MPERTPATSQEPGKSPAADHPPDVQAKARELSTQVQEGVRDIGTQMRHWAQEKGDEITAEVQEARPQGEASASPLADLSRTTMDRLEQGLEQSIRHKPLQSVMIAAGAGLLLGLLWKK
jgi:ElaB/YqjD/DUF883 family membrane-anchored ribosome-binding protein